MTQIATRKVTNSLLGINPQACVPQTVRLLPCHKSSVRDN